MRLIVFVLAVISSQMVFGQNTYLWKVSSKENNSVSYLFGTYHHLGESYFRKYPILEKSLLSCDRVVTETEIKRDSVMKIFAGRVSIDLQGKIGTENYAQVKDILSNSTVDLGMLTPEELVGILQRKFETLNCEAFVATDQYKLDQYIQTVAQQNGKPNYYLETVGQQLSYLDKSAGNKMTWNNAKKYTEIILKQYEKYKKSGKSTCPALVDLYLNHGIEYKFSKSCSSFNDKQQQLIVTRNDKWMIDLSALMKQGSLFVAVGAEHLNYECGLIAQLKKLGYSVAPVKM